jgi:hypothetical protein
MKFWAVFIALLFATTILQAQVPYGGINMQPYYPGAVTQPYIPQAYYLQPYLALNPIGNNPYATNPYVPDPLSIRETNAEIDALTRQVDQLNNQVTQLQSQLATAQAQVQPAPAPVPLETPVAQPEAPSVPVALVFKNGAHVEAQGYAVVRQILWIFNSSGSERYALSDLDVAATKAENLKRGIHFPDLGS